MLVYPDRRRTTIKSVMQKLSLLTAEHFGEVVPERVCACRELLELKNEFPHQINLAELTVLGEVNRLLVDDPNQGLDEILARFSR